MQVTCTASDANGNTESHSFNVKVQDTTAPALTGPVSMLVEATAAPGSAITFDPALVVTDAVTSSPTTTCSADNGATDVTQHGGTFQLGLTTVTCTSTDAASNSRSISFPVTVRDTTVPVLTGKMGDVMAQQATSSSGITLSFTAFTATDIFPVTTACTSPHPLVTLTHNVGASFEAVAPLGLNDITCTATDSNGKSASHTFKVQVVDTLKPVLVTPLVAFTREATSSDGAPVTFDMPTFSDLFLTGNVAVNMPSGATYGYGEHTATFTQRDTSGNEGSASLTFRIIDTTPPTWLPWHSATGAEAEGPQGASVWWTVPQASDYFGSTTTCTRPVGEGEVEPTSPGQTYPLGETHITCTAVDSHGNTQPLPQTLTITVTDTWSPMFDMLDPPPLELEASSPRGAVAWYSFTATDLVDGQVTATCDPPSGSRFAVGEHQVTCTAKDNRQNEATMAFTHHGLHGQGPGHDAAPGLRARAHPCRGPRRPRHEHHPLRRVGP